MEIRQTLVILYVQDLVRSRDFYKQILQKSPSLDVPGMVEFTWQNGLGLGLMPDTGIAKILLPHTPSPELGRGIPRCEWYWRLGNPEAALERVLAAGALPIQDVKAMDWGERVGYCADPDGHVLAFAGM